MVARTDRAPRRRLDPDSRRATILAAAVRQFGESPYPSVSVASIAGEAGASEALVHKYFEGKAGLYAAALSDRLEDLAARRRAAAEALPPGASVRDQIRAVLLVQLDAVAGSGGPWTAVAGRTEEPPAAVSVRDAARRQFVAEIARLLPGDESWARHRYALWGFVGFLDGASAAWAARACPDDDRWAVVEAALGALEGARGDWAG